MKTNSNKMVSDFVEDRKKTRDRWVVRGLFTVLIQPMMRATMLRLSLMLPLMVVVVGVVQPCN